MQACVPGHSHYLLVLIITAPHSYFRTEDTRESVICDVVGNVTADTELTYEYGVRKKNLPKQISDQEKGE